MGRGRGGARAEHRRAAAIGLVFAFLTTAQAQVALQFPKRDYDALSLQSSFWIGTPGGLYQYRPAENVWSVKSTQNGLPTNAITRLASDEEALWIGRDHGVTKFDAKSNVLLSYDSADGIPAGAVLGMAFEADYAWIGTEHGVARYDKLIEQWQTIDRRHGLRGEAAYAIAVRDGATWIFTDDAVNEYDPRFERWRRYGPDSSAIGAKDVLLTGTAAWIVRERDLLRFDYASRVFQRYPMGEIGVFVDIRLFVVDGSSFWIVTKDALWYYDAQNDSFRPFLEIANLPDREIRSITLSTDGSSIVFATRTGVSRYDRGSKTWQYFNEAGGLPRSDFGVLFCAGSDIIGLAGSEFAYLSSRDNRWYGYALVSTEDQNRTTIAVDPARGTYADFGSGVRLSLSGTRASWLWKSDDPFSGSGTTAGLYDLKAKLELGGERSISAGYNNADYADVMYGAQYRGARDDVVQSLQVGDVNVEQGNRQFLPSFGVFGGGGRISLGARTERYHRALLEVAGVEGHQTTAIASDFYTGRTRRRRVTVRDIDYLRREWFRLPTSAGAGRIDPSTVEVYRSVLPGSGPDSFLSQSLLAGKSAFWERVKDGQEYLLDDERAVLRYPGGLPASRALAARYADETGARHEALLATEDSSALALVNRYFLLGTSIIPSSFSLSMRSATGVSIPLASFGLDADGNGAVDGEFLDFRNGGLSFPAERPFSPAVYRDSAVSSVTMVAEFETFNSSYVLSNRGIVRGSERILVDGIPVRAGDDYVLDYTSGYLLFTRDGVISDNSGVEVTYEYTLHSTEDRYGQITLTFSPSDNAQVSVAAAHFDASLDGTAHTALHVLADVRTQNEAFDLRVLPEYSRTMSDSISGNAFGIQSWFSSGAFRLNARTRRLEDSYTEKFARLFPGGNVRDESSARSEFDATASIRLFAEWNRRSGWDSSRQASRDERVAAGVQWVERALPSVTVRAERLTDEATRGSHTRRALRGDIEYVLPAEALGISSGLFSSYIRFSDEQERLNGSLPNDYRFQNYYLRALISPRPSFTVNTYYRGDLRFRTAGALAEIPAIAVEKVFSDVVIESIRGLSLTGRYVLDLRGLHAASDRDGQDIDRRSSVQLASRISPGFYIDALKSFTLDLSAQSDRSAYFGGERESRTLFLSLFRPTQTREITSTKYFSLEGRMEWRPTAELIYFLTGRMATTTSAQYGSSYTDLRNEVLQRLDYRMGSSGLYSAQLSILNSYNPWSHVSRIAPALWLEQRWSALFLTRLTLNASIDDRINGMARYQGRDFSPGINLTFTASDIPVIRKFEIRDDLSYNTGKQRTETSPGRFRDAPHESLANAAYLDLYPHPTSYIRLQYLSRWMSADAPSEPTFQNSGRISVVVQL
jgi:hypothetical protein